MSDLKAAAALLMEYERWRDASPRDRLDPTLGPQVQINVNDWAERAAAMLARLLESADSNPFVAEGGAP